MIHEQTTTVPMNEQAMQPPEYFQVHEEYAAYDPIGVVSLEKAASLISSAIIFARDHNIKLLLVDARQLTGFPSPSVPDRYFISREWAREAKSRVKVAVVLQRYMIDPERFGVQVAINLGMRANVFDSRPEALAWLLSGPPNHTEV